MDIKVDRIEPEAVDAALQPEACRVEHRVLGRLAVEVQIRLSRQEVVQIILPPPRVPFPCRAAENRQPVVGRRTVRLGIGPDIPVGLGIVARGAAFLEPRMLVGGVRNHLVDHHFQAEPVGLGDQRVEIRQRPEHRIDVAIVRHVISEILHRRLEERRYPYRIGSERGDIRQTPDNALQIADAIAIGVLIAARIDLIDHRAAPPVTIDRVGRIFQVTDCRLHRITHL